MNKKVIAITKDVLLVVIVSCFLLALITNVHFFKSDISLASSGCLDVINKYKAAQEITYGNEGAYRAIYKNGHDAARSTIIRYYWKKILLVVEEEVANDHFTVTCKAPGEVRIPISWFATQHSEVQSQRISPVAPSVQ
ncbi:MAG: hypothetical protein ACK6DX_17630 [Acidobacteriota bacterium]